MNTFVYPYKKNLYVNLTNRCTSSCTYCIRYKWNWKFRGYNLKLKKEPSFDDVINSIRKYSKKKYREIVFCGYGEPMLRLNLLKKLAAYLKKEGFTIRINTNGHGNLIWKRNICPELEGIIDNISISLNACNPWAYYSINKPEFGIKTFDAVLEFIKQAKKYVKNVNVTFVKTRGASESKCKQIANKIGVNFRARPFLDKYESE